MINDYECPRCHNIFPESNKILHDIRCTEENPVPNKDNLMPLPQNTIQIAENNGFQKNLDFFECNICHMVMPYSEKNDHILCHDLEKQEKKKQKKMREIAEQKKIEKEIGKRNNQKKKMIEQQRQIERQIQLNNRANQRQIQNNNQRQNHNNNNNRNDASNDNNDADLIDNILRNAISIQDMISNNLNHIHNHNHHQISNINQRNNHNNNMNNNDQIYHRPQSSNNLNNNFNHIRIHFNQNNRNQFPPHRYEHPTDKQILNQLPETYIEDVNKLDSEKRNCVICLEDFKTGDKAIILPCIHIFHNKCIKNWLKTQNSCPICKYKLTARNMNSQ